jgi:hypothetical protein
VLCLPCSSSGLFYLFLPHVLSGRCIRWTAHSVLDLFCAARLVRSQQELAFAPGSTLFAALLEGGGGSYSAGVPSKEPMKLECKPVP